MYAVLGHNRIRLDPQKSLGKGGEADIFDIGGGMAVKIFKPQDHPDLVDIPDEQKAARERIYAHQTKLPALLAFRGKLPARVILPLELARDAPGGAIIGYAMPAIRNAEVLMRYAERPFREAGISNDTVVAIFLDLYGIVDATHAAGIVIGDFNDLNVLVRGEETFLIDTDSFQFGNYVSKMFTARFVDPKHCDPKASSLILARPYSENTDWYAYVVMLMQSFLFVGPYGGVYRPKDPKKRVAHDLRALKRITVFNPDVLYPKPAVHYRVLPDDILHYFHGMFEKDERGTFPRTLIANIRWQKCAACGLTHARTICPVCATPGLVKETVRVSGRVLLTEIFKTKGVILYASYQRGKLVFISHESERFSREDGKTFLTGALNPLMRFRILGDKTLVGKGGRLATLAPGEPSEQYSVDTYGSLPLFDVTSTSRFWVANGRLMKDGVLAPEEIGDVLRGQTLFWVGEKFGFGFYRAGTLSVAFVFEPHTHGINDSVRLPGISGRLIDSTAVFADERVWFFIAMEVRGKTINRCFVIRRDGTLEATAEGVPGDGSWLSTIRGKSAVGRSLFAPTDGGIVRVEVDGGIISIAREFPDTEPYVDEASNLFVDTKGIYVVREQSITHLALA